MNIMDRASSRALSIELIIQNVLSFIDSPATLTRCARVNGKWYQNAVRILWKGSIHSYGPWATPDMAFLMELSEDPTRFRYYMSFVRHLRLGWGSHFPASVDDFGRLFEESLWSTLQPLSIYVDSSFEFILEKHLVNVLKPGLLCLEIWGGYYSDGLLSALREKSPRIVHLLIDNLSDDMTSTALRQFVVDMPQIRIWELIIGFETIVTEPVVLQLMAKDNLDRLALSNGNLTSWVISQHTTALTSLQSLRLHDILPEVARKILPRMTQLRQIELCGDVLFSDLSRDILLPLSHCSRLLELDVWVKRNMVLEEEHLATLAKGCPQLQSISFQVVSENPPDYSESEEGVVASLAARLPALEQLMIDLRCRVATWEITAVGRGCQKLRTLGLNAPFDLRKLDEVAESGVLFPVLEELKLSEGEEGGDHIASDQLRKFRPRQIQKQLAAILRERIPSLKCIQGGLDDEMPSSMGTSITEWLNEILSARAPEKPGPFSSFLLALREQIFAGRGGT